MLPGGQALVSALASERGGGGGRWGRLVFAAALATHPRDDLIAFVCAIRVCEPQSKPCCHLIGLERLPVSDSVYFGMPLFMKGGHAEGAHLLCRTLYPSPVLLSSRISLIGTTRSDWLANAASPAHGHALILHCHFQYLRDKAQSAGNLVLG